MSLKIFIKKYPQTLGKIKQRSFGENNKQRMH